MATDGGGRGDMDWRMMVAVVAGCCLAAGCAARKSDQALQRARLALEVGQYQQALDGCTLSVRLNPANGGAWTLAAQLFGEEGKIDEAMQCWYAIDGRRLADSAAVAETVRTLTRRKLDLERYQRYALLLQASSLGPLAVGYCDSALALSPREPNFLRLRQDISQRVTAVADSQARQRAKVAQLESLRDSIRRGLPNASGWIFGPER